MRTTSNLCVILLCLLAAPAPADEGNGLGGAYLENTVGRIGGMLTISFGSDTAPFKPAAFIISDGVGPVNDPTAGLICLDINSPAAQVALNVQLDVNGNHTVSFMLPNLPALATFPPVFGLALIVDPDNIPFPFIGFSKTIRLAFENPDSYTPVAPMSTARALHTSTAINDDPRDSNVKVINMGGGNGSILSPVATNTTEIYRPLQRDFVPGPNMAVDRALHTAVRLQNGLVLVAGGTSTTGVVTTSCELFDPQTGTFTPTGSLNTGRAGHAMSLLPDGRALISGGVTTFMGGSTNLAAVLNTARNDCEVYDPTTGTWSTVAATMSSSRFGHAQVVMANGTVLISAGINGGIPIINAPTMTSSCDIFDPANDSITQTGSMTSARVGHQMSVLGNGTVLATGGAISLLLLPTADTTCQVFNGASWSPTGSLPTGVALHSQVTSPAGHALLFGGITGSFPNNIGATAMAGVHDGVSFTPMSDIGLNPAIPGAVASPRGSMTVTRTYDGSYLVAGGADANMAVTTGFVFTE